MSSLYKRATPSQTRLLRIIEGAVLNTADAHGEKRDIWTARSIAKRAAGTLSSQWTEVLAANTRLSEAGKVTMVRCLACERRAHLTLLEARREFASGSDRRFRRRVPQLLRRSPLLILWVELKREMWHLKRNDPAQYQAQIKMLRMIDKLRYDIRAANQELNDVAPYSAQAPNV